MLPQPDGRHLTLGPSGPAYPPPPQPRTLGMERCSSLYPGVSTSTNPAPPSLLHRSQVQWQPPQRGLSRPLELLGFSLPSMFLVCPAYQRMSAGGGLSRCLPRAGWMLSAALESRWAEALASLLELSYKGALGSPRRPTYCPGLLSSGHARVNPTPRRSVRPPRAFSDPKIKPDLRNEEEKGS